MSGEPFWVNPEHDRLVVSDGLSRYRAYVPQRVLTNFAQCWDGTFEDRLRERFALLAWRTATTPVTAPRYVGWRTPVLSVNLRLDTDGGSDGLIAAVEIACPWPRALRDCHGHTADHHWCSWSSEQPSDDEDYFRGPYDYEVADGSYYALCSLRLVFPVYARLLPAPPSAGNSNGEVREAARHTVATLVAEFNRAVWPVITVLESE